MDKRFYPFLFLAAVLLVYGMLYSPLPPAEQQKVSELQREKDDIFMLAAYSLVLRQYDKRQGHNIAALLVKDGKIREYALNTTNQKNQKLYHAEMNLVLHYLGRLGRHSSKIADLDKATVYVTLEPCPMCYGTLLMQDAGRVIYGQTDPYIGATRLLAEKTTENAMTFERTALPYAEELEKAYGPAHSKGQKSIIRWLARPEAVEIFRKAYCRLLHYPLAHPQNEKTLQDAQAFVRTTLPRHFSEECPK